MPCTGGSAYRKYACYYRDSVAGNGLVISDYNNHGFNNNNTHVWNSATKVGINTFWN